MENLEIRTKAKENGVKMWQIADVIGIHQCTLSNHLRHELKGEERQKVLSAIDSLSKG